ncbi:response regulator receiver protein [Mycolicibacterium celeriflavum]|uniref:ANTAR domain-containing response regulator n=1 Tax=Mycolicibacterium celeriflavum TaxID=1249101 RepID=UPI0007FE7497|nr:GAF and ANTAR domain-containing protein [Mycolicibacterium celeriflavum]OBG18394.1 response regulator receiver protein [Mycolicibacterium celeriflavum]
MTGSERPDPLTRLDATSEAIAGLRDIFAVEEPLGDVLTRVAQTAARAVPDADAVSITVLNGDTRRTPACTDERIVGLDHLQQESGRGPCIEAAQEHKPLRVQIDDDQRWPEFAESAKRLGIRACLSVPLLLGDGEPELVGSLNIYSYTVSAFDPFDEGLMRLYTVAASQAITNARRWQQTRDTVSQLEHALTSRAEIDQAKGALMAIHGCSAEEAFQRLVHESQDRNIKLYEIARSMLASLQRTPD